MYFRDDETKVREGEGGVMDKLMTRGDVNPVSHVGGMLASLLEMGY